MDVMKTIAAMLDDASPRKKIAAAVVMGELGVKDAAVVARLIQMAKDPLEAYAEAAVEALGDMQAVKALPVLIEALGRGRTLRDLASKAIGKLGEGALPEIKAHLATATPEIRAALSALLPSVGGRQSLDLALEGLLGQPFDAVNRVALSLRQEAKTLSPAEKKTMRGQIEKFLEKKKTQADEPATRGALKMLGFLELPEAEDVLLGYLGKRESTMVKIEAITALRFALSQGASKKTLRKLMELLEDPDVLLARAARDTLTVLNIGPQFSEELSELCSSPVMEVALWAIGRLGILATEHKLLTRTLLPIARGADRVRAEAASKVIASLKGAESLLAEALCDAEEEAGAQVLCDALMPLAHHLARKDVQALLKAGAAQLAKHLAVARRQLEPVRVADPEAWADALRGAEKKLLKKDEARADAIGEMLVRSNLATPDDRYQFAVARLMRSSLDPHPKSRARDVGLVELSRLVDAGAVTSAQVTKEKRLGFDVKLYVGFHFAEGQDAHQKAFGGDLLEFVAKNGKGKIAKAAKNKLKLLAL